MSDIVVDSQISTLSQEVLHRLRQRNGNKFPSSLLYDAAGSKIFEEIVGLDDYYPYVAEAQLLQQHAASIAHTLPPDCVIIDLGCGTATKSAYLLNAIQSLYGGCRYVGIDVSQNFLTQARMNLLKGVRGLEPTSLHFIQGDYVEGLKQARQVFPNKLFCILWLGTSIGNFTAEDAVCFLKTMLKVVGPKCLLFTFTDVWKDTSILHKAYHDDKGVIEAFIKNGMKNALALLGYAVSEEEQESWGFRVQIDSKLRRVELWLTLPNGLRIEKHHVYMRPGESVLVEFSRKFTAKDVQDLATRSNFYMQAAWRSPLYRCQILYSSVEALRSCWNDTDALFNHVSNWNSKPIDGRHPFLFYYGHVCAFTKLKLLDITTDATEDMDVMFSKDIMDPFVLDPASKCLQTCNGQPVKTTVATPEWPSKERLCAYVENMRSTVTNAVEEGSVPMRLICFVLEHERMHQETLEYMLAQQTKAEFEEASSANSAIMNGRMLTNGVKKQNGDVNGAQKHEPMVTKKCNVPTVQVLPGKVSMGVEDSPSVFVWDNEVPLVETFTKDAFMVNAGSVTIEEFMAFVKDGGYDKQDLWESADYVHFQEKGYKWPATWSRVGHEFYVHAPTSTKHWEEVASQPVFVSLAEAEAYCKWAGDFRVMKEEEYHVALAEDKKGMSGLRGGGWEWTSTPFAGFPGFKAMPEYEEYSTDFFDGQHFVLKGSSPATHPALLRDSFRNFYHRRCRYVFAKFRCCKTHANPTTALGKSTLALINK